MSLVHFFGFDDNVNEPGVVMARGGAGRLGGGAGLGGASPLNVATGLASTINIIGFACQFTSGTAGTSGGISLFDTTDISHLRVGPVAGSVWGVSHSNGTVLITSDIPVVVNTWYHVEVKFSIADSGGTVELRINGVTKGTFTGDTRNGGNGTFAAIKLQNFNSQNTYIDDMYLLDATDGTAAQGAPYNTYLGDVQVLTLEPNGNGSSSQWTGSDGNSTDNYLLVDEDLSSTADYVTAAGAGLKDLYTVADLDPTYVIYATQALSYANKTDAGAPPAANLITKGDGGTERVEASLAGVGTGYTVIGGPMRFTDPDGDPLTAARVNATSLGVAS